MHKTGEELLKSKPASRSSIDEVHQRVYEYIGNYCRWGSHRFNSHGYVSMSGLIEARSGQQMSYSPGRGRQASGRHDHPSFLVLFDDLGPLRREFPGFEFMLRCENNVVTIRYRTKGSKGW